MNRKDFENSAIEICKNNGDGIYFIYDDSLSCDAALVLVVKNNEVLVNVHPSLFSGIVQDIKSIQKDYPDLTLFALNKGYFTYPQKSGDASGFIKSLMRQNINPMILNVEL